MTIVARHLLTTPVNHEYQHDQWIGEVRARDLGQPLPDDPAADTVIRVDGYLVLNPFT